MSEESGAETSEERIADLITHPPQVHLTRKDVVERVIGWVTTVIAITGLIIALVAASGSVKTSGCINNILGSRANVTAADSKVTIAFAKAFSDLLDNPTGPGHVAALAEAKVAVPAYYKGLAADQQYRDTHPLGKC